MFIPYPNALSAAEIPLFFFCCCLTRGETLRTLISSNKALLTKVGPSYRWNQLLPTLDQSTERNLQKCRDQEIDAQFLRLSVRRVLPLPTPC